MKAVERGCLLSILQLAAAHSFCFTPKACPSFPKLALSHTSSALCATPSGSSMDLGTPFKKKTPVEVFADVASFAQEISAEFDSYGSGATLQAFEAECATLLGKQSAIFFLTGTQAQNAAIVAHEAAHKSVALHPTSHIVLHACLLDGKEQAEAFGEVKFL